MSKIYAVEIADESPQIRELYTIEDVRECISDFCMLEKIVESLVNEFKERKYIKYTTIVLTHMIIYEEGFLNIEDIENVLEYYPYLNSFIRNEIIFKINLLNH